MMHVITHSLNCHWCLNYRKKSKSTATVPSAVAPLMKLNTAYDKVTSGSTADPPYYIEIDNLSPSNNPGTVRENDSYYY